MFILGDYCSNDVIVEITSNFPGLFRNVKKYSNFINHILPEPLSEQFYLEDFQDGIFYIYKDLDIFQSLNSPLQQAEIQKLSHSKFKGAKLFLKDVIDENTFPVDGITLQYRFVGKKIGLPIMMKTLGKYFQSYQNNDISIKNQKPNIFKCHFDSFRALQLYTERLGTVLQKSFS